MEFHARQGHYIKALVERPQVDSGNEWLWQAFNRLSTTRAGAGLSQSPISYLAMIAYAAEMEMGPGMKEFLWDVLKKLDGVFMSRMAKKGKSTPPPRPTPTRR